MNQAFSLGSGQGFLSIEHAIPSGYEVRELKSCENCGRSFMRKPGNHRAVEIVNQHIEGTSYLCEDEPLRKIIYKDTGDRYCGECKSTQLAPPDVSEYKEMLPTSAEMAHRTYIPATEPRPRSWKQKNRYLTGWKERLMRAFQERGPLSSREITEVTKYNTGMSHYSKVLNMIRKAGIELHIVGSVYPLPPTGRHCSLFFPSKPIAPYYQDQDFTDDYVTRKLAEFREMQAKGEL